MPEIPVVRWDPRKAALVGDDGGRLPTTAQEAKARRYVEGGHVKELGHPVTPEVPWGTPYMTIRRYELAPIPGCRQVRKVWVHEHYDAHDRLVAVDFRCDCPKLPAGAWLSIWVIGLVFAVAAVKTRKEMSGWLLVTTGLGTFVQLCRWWAWRVWGRMSDTSAAAGGR